MSVTEAGIGPAWGSFRFHKVEAIYVVKSVLKA
jgi:hypothetical protein